MLLLMARSHGARILGMFPFPTPSHMIVIRGLMLELASRGHEVTEATPFPESKVIPNYTSIEVKTDLLVAAGGHGKRKHQKIVPTFQVIFYVYIS
jgi:hypothetical protein